MRGVADLAAGNDAGGEVDGEGTPALERCDEAHCVVAERRSSRTGCRDAGARDVEHQAHDAVPGERVTVRRQHADMVVTTDTDRGDTRHGGVLGHGLSGQLGRDLSEATLRVEDLDDAHLTDPLRVSHRVDAACTDPVDVHGQQPDAVREVTAGIRVDEHSGDESSTPGRHTFGAQCRGHQLSEVGQGDDRILDRRRGGIFGRLDLDLPVGGCGELLVGGDEKHCCSAAGELAHLGDRGACRRRAGVDDDRPTGGAEVADPVELDCDQPPRGAGGDASRRARIHRDQPVLGLPAATQRLDERCRNVTRRASQRDHLPGLRVRGQTGHDDGLVPGRSLRDDEIGDVDPATGSAG